MTWRRIAATVVLLIGLGAGLSGVTSKAEAGGCSLGDVGRGSGTAPVGTVVNIAPGQLYLCTALGWIRV
jgi:hypothetical protein